MVESPQTNTASPTPLGDVTVVDCTRHLPGPMVTRLLADLGATVIKVEEPRSGDPVRDVPPLIHGRSTLASILLAGHRSVALDLKKSRGVEIVGKLLAEADVLVESFRPGTLSRLGLAPEELAVRYPSLIVCSVSGWGQTGPHALRAGHDLTYQAIAGALASTGEMPALPIADMVGAWTAVASVVAALYERTTTGRGRWIDAALVDAATHANTTSWAAEAGGQHEVGERLALTGALPCYGLYGTADGKWLAVGCLEPHFWRRFCQRAAREDLIRHQYDPTATARRAVADVVKSRTLEAWRELLDGHDLPIEPVLSLAEAERHPQVDSRGVVRRSNDGSFRLAFPARFDGRRPGGAGALPDLGEQTREILEATGDELASSSDRKLRKEGVGRRPPNLRSRVRRWFIGRRG